MIFNDLIVIISDNILIKPILLRLILALVLIISGFILSYIFSKFIIKLLNNLAKKIHNDFDVILLNVLEKPTKILIIGLSVWAAINVFDIPILLQGFLTRVLRTFIIAIVFWFVYCSADSITFIFERYLNKSGKKTNPVLTDVFRKSLKFFIIVLEIFMIIKEWGYDISGLIAGLGVGGLALSLAAKDAAANLLGSITIMLDKTYSIGDWIQANDIEGFVEEIGFRSTKIRTFANSLISVPNSILSNEPVTNWSKRGKRRVSFNLQIPLNTPAHKIESLISRIKEIIENNDDINQDYHVVSVSGFGEASLEITIYYFTNSTAWADNLKVSQDVNLNILKLFEEAGVAIIPPRSIMVQNIEKTNL